MPQVHKRKFNIGTAKRRKPSSTTGQRTATLDMNSAIAKMKHVTRRQYIPQSRIAPSVGETSQNACVCARRAATATLSSGPSQWTPLKCADALARLGKVGADEIIYPATQGQRFYALGRPS